MKTTLLTTIISFIVSLLFGQEATNSLSGMQQKIDKAFYSSFSDRNANAITALEEQLIQESTPLAVYWLAYAKYYEAIYWIKAGQKEQSAKTLQEGQKALEKLKNKNSEDYALLAMIQSFSIQFVSNPMKMGMISDKVGTNANKAMTMDEQNLRAWLVAASHDFHTPAQYGGGAKAEQYLLKAIELPAQSTVNDSQPSWGKDQAYQMLVQLYLKRDNRELATKYLEQGQKLYPCDYMLSELAKKIKNQ